MNVTGADAGAGILTRALGEELRRARRRAGWTRDQLVERMPSEIHPRTLATYEQGIRQCTVPRLVEICEVLGVEAPRLLQRAIQRAEIDAQTIDLNVDLHALTRDDGAEYAPLREWAQRRLATSRDDSGIVRLASAAVGEMAILLGYTQSQLRDYLGRFTPERERPPAP